jgi:hypothetical protein
MSNKVMIYILLERNLKTEHVRVKGAYETYQDAQEDENYFMDLHEETHSYKIVEKEIQ